MREIPFGMHRLVAGLQYGAGLRLLESCRLRIKDIDFGRKQLLVRNGKGEKDRYVTLPEKVCAGLQRQVRSTRLIHKEDVELGAGHVWMAARKGDGGKKRGRSQSCSAR